jgi:orotidine-5'-phosphate decarboxylase
VKDLRGKDRLIVALDVNTADEALTVVDKLDNVTFFKIGWQLYITGDVVRLLSRLRESGLNVFIDLKIPGDIGNTLKSVVARCAELNVKFLTLSDSVPMMAITAAREARGQRSDPKLLIVPLLSSLDAEDLREMAREGNAETYIVERARRAISAGCDGVIASGDAIRVCHQAFGSTIAIVSPGIRPAGASTDDHKRHTTPARAIQLGADYLVVGRPILGDSDPRHAAQRIIDEIDEALETERGSSGRSAPEGSPPFVV